MEAPFPAVSTGDPVREAVELLAGERQALIVTERRAAGRASSPAPTCWSRWSHERPQFATRVVHAGLEPDPCLRRRRPADPPGVDVRAAARPGSSSSDFDYSRSANPTRAALERALGELEGGLGSRVLQRHGRRRTR